MTQPQTQALPSPYWDGAEDSIADIELPLYYKDNYFASDTLYHAELRSELPGMDAEKAPYTLRHDNVITLSLLVSFVLGVVSLSGAREFILRQASRFFRLPRENDGNLSETTSELHFQIFLVLQTALMVSLLAYFFTLNRYGDTFRVPTRYHVLAIFFGVTVAYLVVKSTLQHLVAIVFFDEASTRVWNNNQLFLYGLEGLLLFPLVLSNIYFTFTTETSLVYLAIVVIFVKILTFYKAFVIFFRHDGTYVQIILYFCTLEIVPLAALAGTVAQIGSYLTINF